MKTKISNPKEENKAFNSLDDIFKTLVTGLMYHSLDLGKNRSYGLQKISTAHHFLLLQNFIAMHGINMFNHDYFI